jgi:hypothetical protein
MEEFTPNRRVEWHNPQKISSNQNHMPIIYRWDNWLGAKNEQIILDYYFINDNCVCWL